MNHNLILSLLINESIFEVESLEEFKAEMKKYIRNGRNVSKCNLFCHKQIL